VKRVVVLEPDGSICPANAQLHKLERKLTGTDVPSQWDEDASCDATPCVMTGCSGVKHVLREPLPDGDFTP